MSAAPLAELDAALAGGASPLEVLDLVEGLIEQADPRTRASLADRLDAVAAERGGEWEMLARARPARDPVFAGWWARIGALVLLVVLSVMSF